MATGAIFSLITNDGRQDRLLMATALLNSRLKQIQSVRAQNHNISDPTPTLADIEKTHIIFMNAHFKPFAAIGYEYNKVAVSSGEAELGNDIQFAIPQFGDFFHDMVLHLTLRQPVLQNTATKVGDQPAMRWCHYPGERIIKKCQFEVNGNPLDEYTSHLMNFYREFRVPPSKMAGWKRCVGQELPNTGYEDQPNWTLSGVPVTDVSHRFGKTMYNGDQTPSGQKDLTTAGDLDMFIPLLFWCNTDPRLSIPSVSIPYGQRFINVTLADQEEMVNYYPRGFGSYTTPLGAVSTSTNLIRNIELYINNIFVNPEVHDIFIKRIGFQLIRVHRRQTHSASKSSDSVLLQQLKWPIEVMYIGMRVKDYTSTTASLQAEHMGKWHTFSQVGATTAYAEAGWLSEQKKALTGTSVTIAVEGHAITNTSADHGIAWAAAVATITSGTAEPTWPDEVNIGDTITWTDTTPQNIVAIVESVSTTVIVARATVAGTATPVNQALIYNTSSPTGYALVTGSGDANFDGGIDANPAEIVAGDGFVADGVRYTVIAVTGPLTMTVWPSPPNDLSTAITDFYRIVKQEKTHTIHTCSPTLDTITLKAHGVPIYNTFPTKFFNAYVPFHYGGPNITTPTDCGAMMVTFNLYPGTYQPSGHINISRAREFYLDYTSSIIDGSTNGTLIVVAKAINFLLIADGSAVLRYST